MPRTRPPIAVHFFLGKSQLKTIQSSFHCQCRNQSLLPLEAEASMEGVSLALFDHKTVAIIELSQEN